MVTSGCSSPTVTAATTCQIDACRQARSYTVFLTPLHTSPQPGMHQQLVFTAVLQQAVLRGVEHTTSTAHVDDVPTSLLCKHFVDMLMLPSLKVGLWCKLGMSGMTRNKPVHQDSTIVCQHNIPDHVPKAQAPMQHTGRTHDAQHHPPATLATSQGDPAAAAAAAPRGHVSVTHTCSKAAGGCWAVAGRVSDPA